MPTLSWIDHPALAACREAGVRTRLGVSPNHPSLRVGVLRTHLLTAVFAHAVGSWWQVPASVFLRWDDTNRARVNDAHKQTLLREITEVAQIPVVLAPDGTDTWSQSARHDRYRQAIFQLSELGLVTSEGDVPLLSVAAVHRFISAHGQDPRRLAHAAVINLRNTSAEHPEPTVPLARADGSALWHLASVVDDIDLGVNLVVRGNDKASAVAIQERLRWALTGGERRVGYLFVPRLLEPDGERVRVASLLDAGIRPSALRWFLTEPWLAPQPAAPPEDFAEIAARIRRVLPTPTDSAFDRRRLFAFDRKASAHIAPSAAAAELRQLVGNQRPDLLEFVATFHRRPLPAQARLYRALTGATLEFDPPPSGASAGTEWVQRWLAGPVPDPPPPAALWVLTGHIHGPAAERILQRMPPDLVQDRVTAARRLTAG